MPASAWRAGSTPTSISFGRAVEHPLGRLAESGLHHDEAGALAAADRVLRLGAGHRRQLERLLELLEERARAVGVVFIDDGDADLALLAVVVAAEHEAEQHRDDDRPDEREEHAAAVARHQAQILAARAR